MSCNVTTLSIAGEEMIGKNNWAAQQGVRQVETLLAKKYLMSTIQVYQSNFYYPTVAVVQLTLTKSTSAFS